MTSEEKKIRKPKTKREPATADEILKIIQKQWATTQDIVIIGCVGINKAIKEKEKIAKMVTDEGRRLPPRVVPMDKVVEYYKININYLKKVANIQKR